MQNYNPNQIITNNSSSGYNYDIVQKASELKQSEKQEYMNNVKQYVRSTQTNHYGNSVEQNAQNLKEQDVKNYMQQMNNKLS